MRLIDVDNYCKNICRCDSEKCDKNKCPIMTAPTAYDADKAVEQSTPRKPIKHANGGYVGFCPVCRSGVFDCNNFCSECGQKLDWGDDL